MYACINIKRFYFVITYMCKGIPFVVFFLLSFVGRAQVDYNPGSIKGGLQFGAAAYHGDLCPFPECLKASYAIGVSVRRKISKQLSFRPQLNLFRTRGNHKDIGDIRSLSYRSDNLSLSFELMADLSPEKNYFGDYNPVIPYVWTGLGGMFFNPETQYQDNWYALQPLSTEGVEYSRFSLFIPAGIGARFRVSDRLSFSVEYKYQFNFTDYLDDVSGNYIEPIRLYGTARALADRTAEHGHSPEETLDGKHWTPGTARGNESSFDGVSMLLFSFEYELIKPSVQCPLPQ